jgi:hypothetical protein
MDPSMREGAIHEALIIALCAADRVDLDGDVRGAQHGAGAPIAPEYLSAT